MDPLTLEFADAALEKQYVTETFRAAYRPFCVFCGVFMMMMGGLSFAFPNLAVSFLIVWACQGIWLVTRVWVHRMHDQKHARVLFGRAFNGASFVQWVALVLQMQENPPGLSPAGVVPVVALLLGTVPLQLRLTALLTSHRLTNAAISLLGFVALPPWSEMGRPSEPLWMWHALLIGELVGHSLEQHMRHFYLPPLASTMSGSTAEAQPPSAAPEKTLRPAEGLPARPVSPPQGAVQRVQSLWTLEFDDAALEARYAAEMFVASYRPMVAFCAAVSSLNVIHLVGAQAFIYARPLQQAVMVGGSLALASSVLVVRVWLRHVEVQRARLLAGRIGVVVTAAVMATLSVCTRDRVPDPVLSAGMLALRAMVLTLWPSNMRLSALHGGHHLAILATLVGGIVTLPELTDLGRPTEPVCLCSVLLLGELLGFTLDSHLRDARLRLHEREQQQQFRDRMEEEKARLIAQKREAEAKAERYAGSFSERLCRSFDLSLDLVVLFEVLKEEGGAATGVRGVQGVQGVQEVKGSPPIHLLHNHQTAVCYTKQANHLPAACGFLLLSFYIKIYKNYF